MILPQLDFMHPELFGDRLTAWIKVLCECLELLLARIGPVILSAIALWQTMKSKVAIKEAKAVLNQRLDSQAERINAVALATNGKLAPVEPLATEKDEHK